MAGVTPENRNQYQTPNHITNVQQFMMNEQYIRDIIAVIEKATSQNGRALSKVEAKVMNLGKGIVNNYNKISEDLKASGRSNVNKNEAQILKSSLDDLFKEMRYLIQTKGSSGIGKNERADESWAEVARLGQLFADNITQNLERITAVMENITSFQNESRRVLQQATQSSTSASGNRDRTLMEALGGALRNGFINERQARTAGYEASNAIYHPHQQSPKDGPNFFTATAGYRRDEEARRAYYLSKNSLPYGPVQPSAKDLRKWGASDAVDKFAGSTSIWQNLNKVFSSIPILGNITGAGSKMSASGSAMKSVGKSLSSLGGKFTKIGKVATLLGGPIGAAIGIGVATLGMIYQQMKKASPVLQAVSNLFELAWNLLWMPLGNMLGTVLLPLAETMINFAIAFNQLFSDFSMQSLLDVTMRLGEVLMATFQTLFNMLFDILITLPFKIAMLIPNLIYDAIESVLRACGLDDVADGVKDFKNKVNSFWTSALNWIKAIPSIIGGLPNVLLAGLKSLLSGGDFVQGVKDRWNDTIGNWTGIRLATGGVVTNPTIAMVGEAGPEAVIPLDRASGIGTTYVININGDVYGVSDLESRIERAIQRTANKAYYR